MIEYLKIEITPVPFAEIKVKKLKIRIRSNGKDFEKHQLIQSDELVSFFNQIWSYAGEEILKAIKKGEQNDS